MAAQWPLLALTALLCSALCSGHRATPLAAEPAPFRSEPNPVPGTQSPPQVLRLAPPKPPPEFNRAPAHTPVPVPAPAGGPTPASGPVPASYMESEARLSPSMSPAPLPPATNDESNIAVNCCGAGWGSPGCGGTSCPGGGGSGCGASPCPTVPKNPYYCQPAGCGGNQGYGCGGGFTIYMGDHFTSGDEKKP